MAWPPSSCPPSVPLGALGMLTLCSPAGTKKQAIIDVLMKKSNAVRQQIVKSFKAQFSEVNGGQVSSGGWGACYCQKQSRRKLTLDKAPVCRQPTRNMGTCILKILLLIIIIIILNII